MTHSARLAAAAWVAASLFAAPAAGQTGLFNGEVFQTGGNPLTLSGGGEAGASVLFDVDRDGHLDAIVDAANGLRLMWGRADGGFDGNLSLGTTAGWPEYFLSDLDGDGEQDLVVAGFGAPQFFAHDGVDSLLPPVTLPTSATLSILGDVDGDGDVDIIGAQGSSDTCTISLNDGAAGFTSLPPFHMPRPDGMAAGDLNGDGHLDLVSYLFISPVPGYRLMSYLGNGVGDFFQVASLPGYFDGEIATGQIELADMDADGDLDVVMALDGLHGGYAFIEGDGGGDLAHHSNLEIWDGVDFFSLIDFDQDGQLDLLGTRAQDGSALGRDHNVILTLGLGGFAFDTPMHFSFGPSPVRAMAADVDGQGQLDLIVSMPHHAGMAVVHGELDGGPLADRIEQVIPEWTRPTDVKAFDLEGDGDLDLTMLSEVDGLTTWIHDGTGGFSLGTELLSGNSPQTLGLGDINKDGLQDVIVGASGGRVLVRLNDGAGGWIVKASKTYVGGNSQGVLADMDEDGELDIVASATPAAVSLGNGLGNFPTTLLAPSGNAVSVAVGDIDGDGHLDVLSPSDIFSDHDFDVYFGDGTGALAAPQAYTFAVDGAPFLGDLDGDTDLDLVLVSYNDDVVRTLRNDGTGSFSLDPLALATGPNPGAPVLADVDGDGLCDVVLINASYETVEVFLGLPGGGLSPARRYLSRGLAVSLQVIDFDGDLRPDLVMAHGSVPDGLAVVRGLGPEPVWATLESGIAGTGAQLALAGEGSLLPGSGTELRITGGAPFSTATLVIGLAHLAAPFKGGVFVPSPDLLVPLPLSASGAIELGLTWPAGLPPGSDLYWQAWRSDAGAVQGFAASNGLRAHTP